ncbi:hypothetical protein, partial [Escherichia coli]|uniref:hypothetical protein n=1 Tax=Escherichia coli TaxID=562 RepID=UPI001BDD5178
MQNGIAHNGLILLWRMREGKHLCPGKTTLSDHAVLYLPVSTFVGTGFLCTENPQLGWGFRKAFSFEPVIKTPFDLLKHLAVWQLQVSN